MHQRDVVRILMQQGVKSANDFNWLYYMRYYWNPASVFCSSLLSLSLKGELYSFQYNCKHNSGWGGEADNPLQRLQIRLSRATFYYGFEYLVCFFFLFPAVFPPEFVFLLFPVTAIFPVETIGCGGKTGADSSD